MAMLSCADVAHPTIKSRRQVTLKIASDNAGWKSRGTWKTVVKAEFEQRKFGEKELVNKIAFVGMVVGGAVLFLCVFGGFVNNRRKSVVHEDTDSEVLIL